MHNPGAGQEVVVNNRPLAPGNLAAAQIGSARRLLTMNPRGKGHEMSHFAAEIAKYERRLARIGRSPSENMLACNELLYRALLEHNRDQLEWWQQGKPFISVSQTGIDLLLRGFDGVQPLGLVRMADRLSDKRAETSLDHVRAMGLPDYACDRTILFLPLAAKGQDMPKPRLIITRTGGCEVINHTHATLAHLMGVPLYTVDVPSGDPYQQHLDYVTRQVAGAIGFVETNLPGVRYDERRLVESLQLTRRWYSALHEIYELRKSVPCPDHPRDVFREPMAPQNYAKPHLIVEYYEAYRDELRSRVNRGWSAVGDEKLRILWAITGPYGSKVWDYLVSRGVSVPTWHYGGAQRVFSMPIIGDTLEFGRALSPLEEVTRISLYNSWGGSGERWISDTVNVCKEFQADGIVLYEQTGCLPVMGLGQLVVARLKEEMDIPSWLVEGRQLLGHADHDHATFMEGLEGFVNLCFERKRRISAAG